MRATEIGVDVPHGIIHLFHAYPFKLYQTTFQGVDRKALADLHDSTFRDAVSRSKSSVTHFGVFDATGEIIAFARLAESSWHIKVFDVPYYRLQPMLHDPQQPASLSKLLDVVLKSPPEGVTEVRIDGSDWGSSTALVEQGFRLSGIL